MGRLILKDDFHNFNLERFHKTPSHYRTTIDPFQINSTTTRLS